MLNPGSMRGLKIVEGRLSCTYAEAVYLLHRKGNFGRCEISVLAYIFGREPKTVTEDLKRGMP